MDKHKAINLIREVFGASLQDMKSLSSQDRMELASAIARQKGYTQEQCEFNLIPY